MALKGDLASVDLAQVFQMLALNQKVGMLCISSPRGWRALYFEPRGACLYFDEHVLLDKVVNQTTRNGHLDVEAVREARTHAAAQGVGLADSLIAGGYLSEAELTVMLRSEMEEEIYDLFFWTEAHFEFYEGANCVEGREGHVDPRFVFSTDTLIMEAARRIDEWSFIQDRIAGPLEIYRPIGNAANVLDLEDSALALYDLVDGKRNVSRLVEITGLPAFLVYKGLAVLLDEGLVELVPPGELLDTAAECEQEGRYQDAINVYEKAVSLGEGIPDSHARAAEVYETLQEFELAAYHHKCVAEFSAQAEDVKRAVEIFKHVVSVLPTDLAARERLVELTVGRPDLATRDFDPVANGKGLVDLYLEIGEIERVRAILERLLRDNPFDIELKKSLINVHSKAGDGKRVVELYESIAEDLVQDRKPLEAIKYLQKILMLDRNRKDIAERIRSLYVMDERRRSRRRSMVALSVCGVLVATLGVAWWFYDQHARTRLVTVQARVEKLLETANYQSALDEYRAFGEQFPFTLVVQEVETEISRIDSLELRHQQQVQLDLRRRQEELGRLRQKYKGAWALVPQLVAGDDLDGALQKCEEVLELVNQAGDSADLTWANAVGLEKELAGLRTYIAGAFDLDRRVRASLKAGNWQTARTLLLQAIEQYGMSATVRAARLPVEVRTRPEGAIVYRGGVPIVDGSNGEPWRTPCVVLCAHEAAEELEVRLDGFEPRSVTFDAKADASIELVLAAIPASVTHFVEPVRGAISVRRGYLAAGLRGGKVVLVRLEDSRRMIHQLPGLDELEGRVALTASSAIFATREGMIIALSLADGGVIWSVRPPARPAYDLLVHNGRVLFVDARQRFVAIDAAKGGEPMWFVPPVGQPVSAPVASGRFVFLALADGQVLMIDAIDGGIADQFQTGVRLVAGPLETNGSIVVGTNDGRILAFRMSSGRSIWEHRLLGNAVAQRLVLADDAVVVLTTDDRLVSLDLRDGTPEAAMELGASIVSGPVLSEGRVVVVTRGAKERQTVLRAFRLGDLALLWEFRDGGEFAAGLETLGADVFLPDSKGDVLRFR